ncbi:MAG: glycosyltransferase family 4 protein [Candidatus Acidiferrales bacterium]
MKNAVPGAQTNIEIELLTGCRDKHYVYGLVMALISKGICLDVIGSDEIDSGEFHDGANLNFLNLGGSQRQNDGITLKVFKIVRYYVLLIRYATVTRRTVFHILWNYKFEYFDRTVLMLYFKLLGKKIAFTAHNVNAGQRDSNDSLFNRLTLKVQYRLADHIFVHTEQMKAELLRDFRVREGAVTVIPFGINNAVPCTDLTTTEAKRRLGITNGERTILFFGNIGPYKGLHYLVASFQSLNHKKGRYRLIIAGKPRGGAEKYVNDIRKATSQDVDRGNIIQRIEHIPDQETEQYFKAADVLVLPYTHIFQSGVLFLGYSFGLPVIASDVGSLREDILEGETGYLCRPSDPAELGRTIEKYFESDLFRNLSGRRQQIRDYADGRHSWNVVGDLTRDAYVKLLRSDSK